MLGRETLSTHKAKFISSERSSWILVVVDHVLEGKRICAERVFRDRVEKGFWLLNSRNPNVKSLRKDDEVVFYLGGSMRTGFSGVGTISSSPCPVMTCNPLSAYIHFCGAPSSRLTHVLHLSDVTVWSEAKPMEKVARRVEFIRKKGQYWRYLQGGIVRISQRDFETILEA